MCGRSRFADNIDCVAGQERELVKLVNLFEEAFMTYGMQISAEETQLMTNNVNGISTDITIEKKLETVRSFKYLGAVVSDEGSKPEVLSRIVKTTAAVTKLKVLWNDKSITISSKVRLMRSLAMSIFLYVCETWTITADIEIRRLDFLQTPWNLTQKSHNQCGSESQNWKHHGPYEDLTSVKRCKLKWYGHVTRSSGLAKTILQGTAQEGRRRGRQRKWWEDNIKEWTGLKWNIILWKAKNHKEWRKLVVKSTLVPQRSAKLQDRWDEMRDVWSKDLIRILYHRCPNNFLALVGQNTELSNKNNSRNDKQLQPELVALKSKLWTVYKAIQSQKHKFFWEKRKTVYAWTINTEQSDLCYQNFLCCLTVSPWNTLNYMGMHKCNFYQMKIA